VFKMNIDTDTQFAFAEIRRQSSCWRIRKPSSIRSIRRTASRTRNFYDPRKWLRIGEKGMVARLQESVPRSGVGWEERGGSSRRVNATAAPIIWA